MTLLPHPDVHSVTDPETPSPADPPQLPLRIRYRVRFEKRDLLRWISHRDLAQLWERVARRVTLPLSMTEGFHPKPRIAFPSALALGVESLDEVVELELTEALTAASLLDRLRGDNQPGLIIRSVQRLPASTPKARLRQSDYTISLVDGADPEAIRSAIAELFQRETVTVPRPKKKDVVAHVATQIPRLEIEGDHLALSLAATDAASLRPSDVLDLLGFDDWIERGATIVRIRVRLVHEVEPEAGEDFARAAEAPPDAPADSPRPASPSGEHVAAIRPEGSR